MRLIDADALEAFVKTVRQGLFLDKTLSDMPTRNSMLLNFQQYVHLQPTISAAPVVRGEWIYKMKDNGNCSYSVTAKCSECGWDWFSADGVGNYSAVFGAFITNGDSKPEEAKTFLLENAKSNNKLNYCPNCGAKMEDKP